MSSLGVGFAEVLLGDLNGDGIFNVLDMIALRNAFGTSKGDAAYNPRADLDNDGDIDDTDKQVFGDEAGFLGGYLQWVPGNAHKGQTLTIVFAASDGHSPHAETSIKIAVQ